MTQVFPQLNFQYAKNDRNGFSLLELLAVMTILGMIAMTLTLGLRRPLQNSRFEMAVDKVVDFDNRVRRRCETTSRPGHMLIDLNDNEIREIQGTITSRKLELPAGHSIDQVVTAEGRLKRGQMSMRLDSMGCSISYALKISGPASARWLVCLGGTGQFFESESDDEIAGFFQKMYEARIDAD